jgi:ABC-type transport system involved in cytochrome c biogenesis permease subunit
MMPKGDLRSVEGYVPWSKETLSEVETLPLQDGGRIKPLGTYAGFAMLSLHGARSMKLADAEGKEYRVKPTAWLLDILFRPQFAMRQPTFRVDNSAALEAIGVKPRGKRDRYSYEELEPGREKLGELVKGFEMIEAKKRDPLQNQLADLSINMRTYESLLGYFSFARAGVVLPGSGEAGGPDRRAEMSALMMTAPQIRTQIEESRVAGNAMGGRLQGLLQQVLDAANFAKFGLFVLPPAEASDMQWQSAGNAIMEVMTGSAKDAETSIGDVKALEAIARSAGDEAAFRKYWVAFRERIEERAKVRGEGEKVSLETIYQRSDKFLYAVVFFLMGTLAALGMWFGGRSKLAKGLSWAVWGLTLAGLACCVSAIVMRCVIMQRPPIGNLYDTIIFIGTTVVMLSLLVEWMAGRRFALGLAPIVGTILLILARRYELGDAKDHMDPLVAVLDSNFWLTTHVITITLGYSGGLLSAFMSTGYILMRGLGLDGGDAGLRRSLTRAVYGMICLTLFLSLVGTVLGGIWANYSWGRFWGWDPKENGALMIVLWTLAILHARLGGFLREWGLHLASVFTAIVVTFSWWHVNFLGVGLHNYGFTAGKSTIWAFYLSMLLMLIFGAVAMVLENAKKSEGRV